VHVFVDNMQPSSILERKRFWILSLLPQYSLHSNKTLNRRLYHGNI